jgi:hypothetical protein
MRKIYTKIVFDMSTMEKLEEEYYFSEEPIAECKGDVNVPPPPEATAEEKAIQAEYLKMLQNQNQTTPAEALTEQWAQMMIVDQLKDMGYSAEWITAPDSTKQVDNPAWADWSAKNDAYQKWLGMIQSGQDMGTYQFHMGDGPAPSAVPPGVEPERYLTETIKGTGSWQLTDLPGDSPYEIRTAQQNELNSLQLEYAKQQLEWLKDAREMGEITGDLTAEELALFDEMEANSIQTLTEAVNTQHRDIANSAIADLVARGVWQGDIGAHAMSDISEKAMEQIATGAREISTTKNANILNAMENKKNRQLQEILAAQGNATGTWNASQAAQQAGLQMANQATQYGAGLKAQWDATKMGGVSNMMNYYGQQAQNALNASIANSQNKAGMWGSTTGAIGNLAGLWAIGGFKNPWG